MHRALCQIKISSINSAMATNRYITVSICSLQHSHNYFTTKYPQVVHCNTPRSCSLQQTHRLYTTTYTQNVHYNTPTGCSLQHTNRLFTTTHPEVVHYNIPTSCSVSRIHPHVFHCNTRTLFTATTPTGCSVQHTHKLFTATHPPVVHCNIHTRC